MEKKFDYVSLLKCTRNLKHTIDELVCKNHNEIDVLEIERMRKLIDTMLKKFSSDAKGNNDKRSKTNCGNLGEKNHKIQSKMKEIIDISSSVCAEMVTMKNNAKQKMEDNEQCQNVTNEDNANKRQNDFHKKCESQLKYYEEYVNELECRLKGFIEYMIKGQRSDQKHITREIYLKSAIEKIKRNECYYRATAQRLSEKLDYERKKSEERQKWIDGVVSKVKQLKCTAEKNATKSVELAETLSSFVVDVSNQLQQSESATSGACDDQNRVASPTGSSEIVDKVASGCSQPTGVATAATVVDETFLRPMSHSTMIQDLPCRRNCQCSFITCDESDDDDYDDDDDDNDDDDSEDEVNDHPICLKTAAVKCGRPENDEPRSRCSKLFQRSSKSVDTNNSGTETARCNGGSKLTRRLLERCCCSPPNSTKQQQS